jgi:myosin-crossreactive antigen
MHLHPIKYLINLLKIYKNKVLLSSNCNKLTHISPFFGKLNKKLLISLLPSSMLITTTYNLQNKQFSKQNNANVTIFHYLLNSLTKIKIYSKMRNSRNFPNFYLKQEHQELMFGEPMTHKIH